MHAALARRGIRVDQGWVDAAARAGCTTEEQLFVQFLAHDLRKAATAATLPRPLGDTLGGAWVLQVEAVADVGEQAPRHAKTIKALLTDGVVDVGAVCQGWIDRLELGAKIFVKDAPVQRGVVLLRPDNCRVLDCLGHVKAEALAARARGGGGPAGGRAGGPPRRAGRRRRAGRPRRAGRRRRGRRRPRARSPRPAGARGRARGAAARGRSHRGRNHQGRNRRGRSPQKPRARSRRSGRPRPNASGASASS